MHMQKSHNKRKKAKNLYATRHSLILRIKNKIKKKKIGVPKAAVSLYLGKGITLAEQAPKKRKRKKKKARKNPLYISYIMRVVLYYISRLLMKDSSRVAHRLYCRRALFILQPTTGTYLLSRRNSN